MERKGKGREGEGEGSGRERKNTAGPVLARNSVWSIAFLD
jgi:hypothetical protein